MRRRDFLANVFPAMLAAGTIAGRAFGMTSDEFEARAAAYQKQALANFPFTLVETTGEQAFAKWQELKSSGRGSPVVLGDIKTHPNDNLLLPFGPKGQNAPPLRPVDEILKAAAAIKFPDDLTKRQKSESETALAKLKADLAAKPDTPLPYITETTKDGKWRTYTREETIAAMKAEPREPPLGEWPNKADTSAGLSVAYDLLKGTPLPKVYIAIAPTEDWTTIPAYLRWGAWNECPAPEYHVAAMRLWRDRYGAELVGMSNDTINLRVATRPETRDDALALAREQYTYCKDIVDQGVQTYSALAAFLMANDWWFFWWD